MRKLVAAVGVFVSLANADVRAQGALDAEMHVDDLVWAARACYLEASFRKHDCLAILHVAKKRADRVGRFWVDVLTQYSALGANNPRAREVREYPWSDIEGKPAAFNRRWRLLRALVVEFASGQHTDPCPRAEHWGGTMDQPRGRMVPALCVTATANTFYAVGKP